MRTDGASILQNALEPITGAFDHQPAREDLDVLSRRSAFVIDSLNLSPDQLGQRALDAEATLPAGRDTLTWGMGGDFTAAGDDVTPPTAVLRWSYARASGADTGRRIPYIDRVATTEEWDVVRARYDDDYRSYPRLLRFSRRFDDQGRYVLRFWPVADEEYRIRVAAAIPALVRVDNNATPVILPQGVAALIIAALTVDACQAFGFPVRPEMANAMFAASERLAGTQEPTIQRVSRPAWLIGDLYQLGRYGDGVG